MLTLLGQLKVACTARDDLAKVVGEVFPNRPDSSVITSSPGLGVQLSARTLAEIGDERDRFANTRGLMSYEGSVPITRASGKKHHVGRRMVRNDRLNQAGYL
ncbi:transposase [Streptomyces spectabilis]|uniref:Transposase n=1 Tax=Streptomyces spectabilis TaxID=68270 RepID=A0A7W8F0D8_STRST|nr:transposase [Streptomyces spectabilis]MBB5110114.1 transposase [Streptomyces spectabilis]GGV58716.1 hypothetical protein GCM10010245_91850 [Streptomyces spectabilis]